MRHNKKHGMKLGTDSSHTKAMKRSLTCALLENDRIKTTVQRAKAIRPEVDAVITWAKRGDIAARRQAIAKIGDAELVREVFEKAEQGMWAGRDGGYTRILKLGPRKGDNAPMVILELVNEAATTKGKKAEAGKAVAKKKAAAKKPAAKKDAEKAEETPEEKADEAKATDKAEAPEKADEAENAAEEKADEAAEKAEEAETDVDEKKSEE